MNPLVSILIPAFNAEAWLADAIESALAQTWTRREIVIVNDGSSDQTLAVARRFASKHVAALSQSNQGASAARNKALSVAQGEYIQWLDADDVLAPDKIARQVNALGDAPSTRTLLSGAWGVFSYRLRKARFTPTLLWCDLSPVEWLIRKMGQNLHMQPDSWLVSRDLTDTAGPWDTKLWRDNDGEYFCRVLLASDHVRFVGEAKSYYRHAGYRSVSYIGGSDRKLESLARSMQLHVRYLLSLEDSDRTRAACLTYLRTWLYEFYPHRLDLVEELGRLAYSLGGQLGEPRLPRKYEWLRRFLGWRAAREARLLLPRLRTTAVISWDKTLYRLERRAGRE